MDAALLSALSALAGSIVGGLTSGFTNWLNQRAQTKASLLAHALSRREELFKDFTIAASKTYGEALMRDTPELLKSGAGIDPLKEFAEAARAELQSFDISLRGPGDVSEGRMR
jgi:hypothetical protein